MAELNVRVGDKVVVDHYDYMTVETVKKITPTGLIDVAGNRYRKDGTPLHNYVSNCLLIWTPELQQIIDNEKHRRKVLKNC